MATPYWTSSETLDVYDPAKQKASYRSHERQVVIDTLAKGCFLMGVNQAIRVTLMQKG
jgi:hypothetical protein